MIRTREISTGDSPGPYSPSEKKLKRCEEPPETESVHCDLSAIELPDHAMEVYAMSGIKALHPWQAECLNVDEGACFPRGLELPRNLVYSAPTSGGKSMVAEILVVKTLSLRKLKCVVIVPFVSIVLEKEAYFTRLLGSDSKKVAAFHGAHGTIRNIAEASVLVCTIEKAGWVFARMNDLAMCDQLGLVVADEIQMIGTDPERGKFLESMLSRVFYGTKVGLLQCQIVAMSATVPNLREIADWLDAALYITQYRPVPLSHRIVSPSRWIMSPVYTNERIVGWKRERNLRSESKDSDVISKLCVEGTHSGDQSIVFCHMRRQCSAMALVIAEVIGENTNSEVHAKRLETIEDIRSLRVGEESALFATIRSGVAFHHAGLSSGEREIIESAYREGTITVLVATTTLACGVNLPCKRVIFRDATFNGKYLSSGQYRQMAGRAGRKGYDESGESFILCLSKDSDLMQVAGMIADPPPEVKSSIKGLMERTILEVVVFGLARTRAQIGGFLHSTLMATQCDNPDDTLPAMATKIVDDLLEKQILVENVEISATDLGRAIYSSSLSPQEGLLVHGDILKHRAGMRLDTDLQILYLLAPCVEWRQPLPIDWEKFYSAISAVPEDLCRTLEVAESQVQHIYRNQSQGKLSSQDTIRFQRFYAALIMSDVVNEVPTSSICRKFNTSKGALEGLQDTFSMRASQIGSLCENMKGTGWNIMEFVMKHYADRLSHGVQPELLALSKIPFVKGYRARTLYQAGFRGVEDVANSTEHDLFEALSKSSRRNDLDEKRLRMRNRIEMSAARKILKAARELAAEEK